MSATENDAILKVLYGYYEAFGRNSVQASGFFGEPIMVISPENVVALGTRAELATFFEKVVATILGPNGYSHSKVGECHVRLLNSATALCSGVAIRIKTDNTELQRVGFTYLFRKNSEGWRILGIINTDLDKLT